jgi:hypothetical protein
MKTTIKKQAYGACLALMIFFISFPAFSQEQQERPKPDPRHERFAKIQAMKIAYITQELNLTPGEAEKFWPLYNEFEAKRNKIMNGVIKGTPHEMPDLGNMSDEEVNEMILNKFKEERAMVDLQEEYFVKYKEVLPVKKVARYYEAEKRFRSRLIQGIRDGDFRGQREEPKRDRGN